VDNRSLAKRIVTSALILTLAGLIMGFWVFYGYYIPTFFAGEVKHLAARRV